MEFSFFEEPEVCSVRPATVVCTKWDSYRALVFSIAVQRPGFARVLPPPWQSMRRCRHRAPKVVCEEPLEKQELCAGAACAGGVRSERLERHFCTQANRRPRSG